MAMTHKTDGEIGGDIRTLSLFQVFPDSFFSLISLSHGFSRDTARFLPATISGFQGNNLSLAVVVNGGRATSCQESGTLILMSTCQLSRAS